MNAEQAKKLRAPFLSHQIGKLPKPTKKDNPKGNCSECGKWHGLPAVHLDYVGHAAATDRLLQVDPAWTWKPMAQGPNGEPLLTNGGLWIELTVCGVTRPGFGDDGNGKGMKEVIGDAIRNAAMRFGVALDLWAKEDLHASSDDEAATSSVVAPQADSSARAQAAPVSQANGTVEPAATTGSPFQPPPPKTPPADGGDPKEVAVHFGKNAGKKLGDMTRNQVKWYAENELRPDATAQDRRLKGAAITILETTGGRG